MSDAIDPAVLAVLTEWDRLEADLERAEDALARFEKEHPEVCGGS